MMKFFLFTITNIQNCNKKIKSVNDYKEKIIQNK